MDQIFNLLPKLFTSLYDYIIMHPFPSGLIIAAIGIQQIVAQGGCCSAWWFAPSESVMTRVSKCFLVLNCTLTHESLLVRCSSHLYQRGKASISFGQVGLQRCFYLLKSNKNAGFEPRNGDFVFQNVIGDQQQPGKWSFATWYGPYDTA
jgi:hypothetical protein